MPSAGERNLQPHALSFTHKLKSLSERSGNLALLTKLQTSLMKWRINLYLGANNGILVDRRLQNLTQFSLHCTYALVFSVMRSAESRYNTKSSRDHILASIVGPYCFHAPLVPVTHSHIFGLSLHLLPNNYLEQLPSRTENALSLSQSFIQQ